MDNASFHPKNILDELCIQDKHFFLPLPPYSPDLNPIEQSWAILDYLEKGSNRFIKGSPKCF